MRALTLILLLCITGCYSLPKEIGLAVKQVATSMADQAVWQDMLTRVGAQGITPGIEVYGGMLYVAGGKLTGTSVQFGLEGKGVGSGELSEKAREVILKAAEQPDLWDKIIDKEID